MTLILVSLTGVTWIAVALRQLELMTSQGQDALRFLVMTTLAIPSMLALIAPIALLIGSIHVLNKLSGDSELIVMTAGGMPVWSLLKPLGALALIVAAGVTFVNHLAGPWSQRLLKDYAVLVRTDLMAQVIQPWRFTAPENKLTIHIRDRSEKGELLGLLMHDGRDAKQSMTYLAERALIIKQGTAAYLRMQNGHIVRLLPNTPSPEIIPFDSYTVDLNQLEQRADQGLALRPRERYFAELWRPPASDPIFKQSPGRLSSELHDRLSSPLYSLAFAIIAVAFLGQAQTTRQNRLKAVIAAFTVATACRILGIGAANTAVIRPSMAFMMYLIPIAAGVVAAVAVYWQSYPRPPSRLARLSMAASDRISAAAVALWERRRRTPAPIASRTRG